MQLGETDRGEATQENIRSVLQRTGMDLYAKNDQRAPLDGVAKRSKCTRSHLEGSILTGRERQVQKA